MTLVAGLHLLLGAALIRGLAVSPMAGSDGASTLPVFVPPPITPEREPPPPPRNRDSAARERSGEPDLQARPAPVVLPPPPLALPTTNPLSTADDSAPDSGSSPSAGAGTIDGTGRGAGGAGDGTGAGGSGGSGEGDGLGSAARLVAGNLNGRDYRRIRSFGSLRGEAVLAIEVSAEGRLTRCLPLSGSGNPALDAELCRLLQRTRWEPARDRSGRAVPVALRYFASWDRD